MINQDYSILYLCIPDSICVIYTNSNMGGNGKNNEIFFLCLQFTKLINPSIQCSATLPQISSHLTSLVPTKPYLNPHETPFLSHKPEEPLRLIPRPRLNHTGTRSHLPDELSSWDIHAIKTSSISKARKGSVLKSQNGDALGLCCLTTAWLQWFECLWNCWVLKKTLSWWLEVVEEEWKRSGTTFFYHKCIRLLPENILTVLTEEFWTIGGQKQ